MPLVVVRILVILAVIQLLHQLRGGVTEVERHGQVARLTHQRQRTVDGQISRVALRTARQIDRRLGQDDAPLRPPDLLQRLEASVGQQQRVGVGQPDVLRRRDDQPTRNELRILASLDHPRQPVDGRVRVATTDRLDEGRDDVVMHLAALVVGCGVLLQTLHDLPIRDLDRPLRLGRDDQVEDVEQLSRVPTGVAHQRVGLPDLDRSLAQHHVLADRPTDERQQVFLFQRLQDIDLTTRKQRTDHLERRVLRRGPDERHHARLDGVQQRILLRLAEAVYLVDEEDGRDRARPKQRLVTRPVDHLAHLLHPRADGAQGIKRRLQPRRHDARKRRFAHPGRPPKDE